RRAIPRAPSSFDACSVQVARGFSRVGYTGLRKLESCEGERRWQNGKYRSSLAPLSLTSARASDEAGDKFVNVVAPPPAPLSRSRNLRVRAHLWKWRQSRHRRRAEGDMVRGANRKLLKSIGAAAQPAETITPRPPVLRTIHNALARR